ERVNEWLVVTSNVSSFGGAASSMLINIGADVAFVATTCDGSIRVSARARRDAVNSGVNLGKIMEDISEHYCGTGGGHPGAAGIDVVTDVNQILSECKMRALETLKKETVKNENH
uniref:DHH family phosphoesterase n=1 Tax=Methanohalobium sp. TaxID=2837493 RepID=UPI0025F49112